MAGIAQHFDQNSYTNLFKHSLLSMLFGFSLLFEMAAYAEPTSKKLSKINLEGQISHFHTESTESGQLDNRSLVEQDGIFDNSPLESNVEMNSQMLKIKWDKWRNRVTKKIWKKFNTTLVGGDAFYLGPLLLKYGEAPAIDIPIGTKTYYSYQVTRDRRIVNASIDSSSGNSEMDDLVLRSLLSLDRKSILRFPKGSQRQQITIEASMEITKNGGFEYINYGDIESVNINQ